jgi:hypothetical protein
VTGSRRSSGFEVTDGASRNSSSRMRICAMTVRMNAPLRRRVDPRVSIDEGWYADRIGSPPRPASVQRQRPASMIFLSP